MTSSDVTWNAIVVLSGIISCRVSNPPNVGYRYVNSHCWPMTWMGRTSCDVGVQIGLGPLSTAGPGGHDELERPEDEHARARSPCVVAIQPIWIPKWPRALGPPSGSTAPARDPRQTMRA